MSDLNLSVRARKCLTRLGIVTMGELVSRTPDDLMSVRNFGVTSDEIRQKLVDFELKLRNDWKGSLRLKFQEQKSRTKGRFAGSKLVLDFLELGF